MIPLIRRFLITMALIASIGHKVMAENNADVIVYGSTPGGFCAAIAAAREGASVILLEPSDHVGGMSTGGLSHCDSNQMVRRTVMGLFDEWHTRVVKDYTGRGLKAPYEPSVKDQALWTFEPHVAMRVTMQMLDEAGVKVLTNRYLKSVTKDGPRITSLVTKNGAFTARVFVDGTYEGDLMAAASVDWTIGREGREEYGESLAGKQYPKKKMNINGFDDEGGLLPLLTTDDGGPEEAGDKNVMTYSFRLCLTEAPDNRVPMPEPANYDPAVFEIVRRVLTAGEKGVGFDLYPLPGDKLDGNNSIGGQFSLGLIGGGNEWHSADEEGRKKIWEKHKQYTLELIHFLKTDLSVPSSIRERYSKLGLCKDEFASYDHFSPALYVRESRRMKGMYVISQKDILKTPEKDDPIAISSFPIDSHDCQRIALKGGGVINEGTIFPVRRANPKQGYAYHVPYRSIVPKLEQCDNLVVPVALSCTHVGISSLRIEGTWMIIGQSAGIAAALAANIDATVQGLPYPKLRERLLAQKQVLELPDVSELPSAASFIDAKTLPGIVLDDASAKLTGEWSHSANFKPHVGSGYVFSGTPSDKTQGDGRTTATFQIKVPKSGTYQLLMSYSAHETRAKNVPVIVTSGSYEKQFAVDQTQPLPSGQHFKPVGNVLLESGVQTTITINNHQTVGFVIVDALQLLLNADERPLPVRIDEVVAAGFAGGQPAPLADDAEFLRRIWLDLAGRIPTSDEARHFLDDTNPDKRSRMIDQLLAAPTYAQRMQELFHVVLMERRGDHEKWKQYLHNAFEQNKPWDQMAREVLNPDPNDENRRGAGFFYAKRIEANGQNPIDHPGLTRDVGRLFLGADLQCAQCHDHLFIDDYKQRDFQGLYSVYLNLAVKSGSDVPAVTEKPMNERLEFISVFDPTQNETGPRVPFGSEIPVPEQVKDAAPVSVLALLAGELPAAQNALFSRNIANRLWFVMMGRGLVHPLDLHHSGNPPSHPELLDLLASEFVAHQYDIRWMLQQLALSQTYQRSSRYPVASANADTPADSVNVEQVRPQSYLLANEKRMIAEQLLHSTLKATGNFERLQQATVDGKPNAELTELTTRFVAAFANEPREPEDQINPSVKGALFSLNDNSVLQLLSRQSGNLIDRLLAMTSDEVLADELYLSVFTRRPTSEERNELAAWLTKHNDRREKAIANWAWSMLTSMEFVVNH